MKLMILDGNSIVNRAFFGVRPLTAPDGTVRTFALTVGRDTYSIEEITESGS